METSIIVPTWNRPSVLASCLAAIHDHTDGDYEVIVIDSGSEPRGWTWAANRGVRLAEGLPVLLNDDCLVQPGWLPPLLAALAEDPNLWAVSATDPKGDNWPLNVWALAIPQPSFGWGTGPFARRYIHWQSDCDLMERYAGHYRRVEESLVRHERGPQPTDPELLAVMREWHLNDYGTLPTW
jgi:GT2 family glycosyltransferase